MLLTTTLQKLHDARACTSRYKVLLSALGTDYPQDKPINLLTILESNGLEDALWALCATEQNCDTVARLMAADFAEQVLPIWQKYSQDKRPELAIKAARDFAKGSIFQDELAAAQAAAVAAWAAWDAALAAWDTAGAAWDAWDAALAAWDAALAARAARDAAQQKQREIFVNYLQPEPQQPC
jgi:hypothetical protein